jgi:hypothetical protein
MTECVDVVVAVSDVLIFLGTVGATIAGTMLVFSVVLALRERSKRKGMEDHSNEEQV